MEKDSDLEKAVLAREELTQDFTELQDAGEDTNSPERKHVKEQLLHRLGCFEPQR